MLSRASWPNGRFRAGRSKHCTCDRLAHHIPSVLIRNKLLTKLKLANIINAHLSNDTIHDQQLETNDIKFSLTWFLAPLGHIFSLYMSTRVMLWMFTRVKGMYITPSARHGLNNNYIAYTCSSIVEKNETTHTIISALSKLLKLSTKLHASENLSLRTFGSNGNYRRL